MTEGVSGISPWQELKGQIYLGDAPFIDKIENLRSREKSNREIPRLQWEAAKPDLERLFSEADRNKAMYVAHVVHHYTLQQIGDHLGLHYTTVSRIIRAEQQNMLQ